MKTIYFKFFEHDGRHVVQKQKAATVISEDPNGIVTVEYTMNGKKEIKVLHEDQYSTSPFLIDF